MCKLCSLAQIHVHAGARPRGHHAEAAGAVYRGGAGKAPTGLPAQEMGKLLHSVSKILCMFITHEDDAFTECVDLVA